MGNLGISAPEILVIILVAYSALMIFLGLKIVPEGEAHTVERLGRYMRTLTPGLHFVLPAIDKVGVKVDMKEQTLALSVEQAMTRDGAKVAVDGLLYLRVVDAAKAAYENERGDILGKTRDLAATALRRVLYAADLDEVMSRRDQVSDRLVARINEATEPRGVTATHVEIRNVRRKDGRR